MPNSQSHLFSLAQLLESAEQRQSSMPPPPLLQAPQDDSGLIDILAMQARAREASARPSSRTPLPMVSPMPGVGLTDSRRASTDPDLVAAFAATAKRKQRHAIIGGVATGVALIAFAIGFASSAQAPSPPRVAAVQVAPPVAAPVPPPVAPAPAEAVAPVPEPVAASAPADAPKPKAKTKKKSSHASHASRGATPGLMKVISGGT